MLVIYFKRHSDSMLRSFLTIRTSHTSPIVTAILLSYQSSCHSCAVTSISLVSNTNMSFNGGGKKTSRVRDQIASSSRNNMSGYTIEDVLSLLQVQGSQLEELNKMLSVTLNKVVILETKLHELIEKKTSSPKFTLTPKVAKRRQTPPSEKKLIFESKDVNNVLMCLSSDEEIPDEEIPDDINLKMKGPIPSHSSTTISHIQPTFSNGNTSKMKNQTSNKQAMSRRLSFSNLTPERNLKIPKLEIRGGLSKTQKTVTRKPMSLSTKCSSSTTYKSSEKIMSKTNFVITPEMKLQPVEERVSHYVFHAEKDPSEILLKIENLTGSRDEFQSLCPDRTIYTKIVHMMSLKMTLAEKSVAMPTIWSLPPSFATDVLCSDDTIEDLINKYAKFWMPNIEHLKHIYVPIENMVGNWILVVASIEYKVLYYLDPGFEHGDIFPRQHTINKMWNVFIQMLETDHFPHNFANEEQEEGSWEVAHPVGQVVDGFCQHSAVWILEWLAMGSSFTPYIHVTMKEDVVRIKAAIDLLLGDHNEYKDILVDKAEKAWHTMLET